MDTENPVPFLRLFIAVGIPADVQKAIGRAQSQLQRHAPPGAFRWTRPEQFHVTLKFLGDIPPEQVEPLEKSTTAACASFAPMQLAAHGIGFFPGEHKPRVVWVGANDATRQLVELHRRIEAAVRTFAPAEPPERFTGHITLGRFKPGYRGSLRELLERATVLRDRHFGEWCASEVDIMRSELTSAGARHTVLCRLPLAGNGIAPAGHARAFEPGN
jgi:RNA 2',3'-cyclic 3'-phosphodiesterase